MHKIVLIRHGQSEWNEQNRFTGWSDIDLSQKGLLEARRAGKILKKYGYTFDEGYCSVLKRSIRTLWIILHELDLMWIPVHKTWKLNERHYGALQGLNKDKTSEKYGEKQVYEWRRYVKVRPPALSENDKRYPGFDEKYKYLTQEQLPLTENLVDTEERVLRYWFKNIAPKVKSGEKIIIAAHGNTIRAFMRHVDNIPDDGVINLNVPTGTPLVYELDDNLKAKNHYYLNYKGIIPKEEIPENIEEVKLL